MLKLTLALLFLQAVAVSAWWDSFASETPQYDKNNMKDSCLAEYDELMLKFGSPSTREKGTARRSYRKEYPNLFIDEYVCAIKCNQTTCADGPFKEIIAKAVLKDTVEKSTIDCKCKKAKGGKTCKDNNIPWAEAVELFVGTCYDEAKAAQVLTCAEDEGKVFFQSHEHTYAKAVAETPITGLTELECLAQCGEQPDDKPCNTAVYDQTSGDCYMHGRIVVDVISGVDNETVVTGLEVAAGFVVYEQLCVSAALAEKAACNHGQLVRLPGFVHTKSQDAVVTGSAATANTTLSACLEECYTFEPTTGNKCAFVTFEKETATCSLYHAGKLVSVLDRVDETLGYDSIMLSQCMLTLRDGLEGDVAAEVDTMAPI